MSRDDRLPKYLLERFAAVTLYEVPEFGGDCTLLHGVLALISRHRQFSLKIQIYSFRMLRNIGSRL